MMGMGNYMTQEGNGIINIDCNQIPDKGFIDAHKTKEIVKFRILTNVEKAERKSGGPDVVIKHITGEGQLITRKELSKKYIHTSGDRIIIPILRAGKQYLAYCVCNEDYKVMKLPSNCVATLPNGTKTKPGSYIVARVNENGQIEKSTIAMLTPNIFRKMFKIPPQPVIERHRGRSNNGSKEFKLFSRKPRRMQPSTTPQPSSINRPTFDTSEIGMNPANINVRSVNDTPNRRTFRPNITKPQTNNQPVNNRNNTPITNNKTNYKYRVTSKVVDMNGRMLGFAVQEIATGKSRNLKINELTQLCMNKLVENVMVVRNTRGNLYLKGNGCSLENLPQIIA